MIRKSNGEYQLFVIQIDDLTALQSNSNFVLKPLQKHFKKYLQQMHV